MGASVVSPRLKLERAREHLEAFNGELRDYVAQNPYYAVRELDPQLGQVLRLKIAGSPPLPGRFGVLVGDFVNALRSALDHLVWAMLTQKPKRPEGIEFPIFDDGARYAKEAPRKIGLVPKAAQDEIEKLQPYQGGKDPKSHPLWLIHQLSRVDKHRQISVIAHGFMYSFAGQGSNRLAMVATLAANLKEDPVLPIPDLPAQFASAIDSRVEPTFAVVYDMNGSNGLLPVEYLAGLYEHVRDMVFTRIERFVPPGK